MHAGEQKRSPILSSSVTNPLPARMVAGSKRGELYKNQPDAEGLTCRSPRRSEIPFALRQKSHFLFTRAGVPGLRDTGSCRVGRRIRNPARECFVTSLFTPSARFPIFSVIGRMEMTGSLPERKPGGIPSESLKSFFFPGLVLVFLLCQERPFPFRSRLSVRREPRLKEYPCV